MKKLLRHVILILLLGTSTVVAQTAAVRISPASKEVRVDSVATLTIIIENVVNLHGYSVTVGFDPSLLRCTAARKGSFLQSTLFLYNVDSVAGEVTLDEAILGPATKSGSGNLAEVDFQPKRAGSGELTLKKVDLRDASNQSISSTSTGGSILVKPLGSVVKPVPIQSSWNLLSVPVEPADNRVSSCFPDAISQAFEFVGTYQMVTTLTCGQGYWLKFAGSSTVNITGSISSTHSIAVRQGWNMIGPFESDASTAAITSSPASIVTSQYFAYGNGYFSTTTLSSGFGYWVKVSQAGTLFVPGGTAKVPIVVEQPPGDQVGLEILDHRGRRGMLALGQTGDKPARYDLPPLPPHGAFDVRFSTGTSLERLGQKHHEILIQSAEFPVTVRLQNAGTSEFLLRSSSAGESCPAHRLSEGQAVVIDRPADRLILEEMASEATVPHEFCLEQNFPNPFNPKTVISCQWPVVSDVKMVVYDVLGRQVGILIDERKEPGRYTLEFDASGLASGVYLCRLSVAPVGGQNLGPTPGRERVPGEYVASMKMIVGK